MIMIFVTFCQMMIPAGVFCHFFQNFGFLSYGVNV